ncbi:hypothetical protein [Burkholderia alba]|uniref:hypothetical protein n=1 Tax=Burkholderia alba TaxID=2683677 RepID=UPI002B05FFFA|nr:hypothetical protein [Burkholderia alba]
MRNRKPLGKSMLLPATTASIRERILRNHLALAALLAGQGNGHLLAALIETAYLTWYLQEAGFGSAERAHFEEVEHMINAAAERAEHGAWSLTGDDSRIAGWLIEYHEQQLLRAPVFAVRDAQKRLARFAQSGRRSPW